MNEPLCPPKKKMNTFNRLKDFLRPFRSQGVALAFSGGIDSTLLLAALNELNQEKPFPKAAFYVQSVFQNKTESELVHSLCSAYHTELVVLQTDPLSLPAIKNNRTDRCYWCKKNFFTLLLKEASKKNLKTIIDGTNADDLKTYRPGLKALQELKILSPLSELGISKKQIRETAITLRLQNATKPSTPCLATRFEYNTELSDDKISMVERGEAFLRKRLDLNNNFRLRVHDRVARIEVSEKDLNAVLKHSSKITHFLKELGFSYVTLDLEGFRSGSMDEPMKK